jgi:hypothetical protein
MPRRSRVLAVLLLAGCSKPAQQPPLKAEQTAQQHDNVSVTPTPAIPPPATGPDARTPLGPPAKAADPKSTEAAVELGQRFADLLNGHKFDEAYMLLGPSAPPRDKFDSDWRNTTNLRVTVGAAGDQEGAAGSIYLSLPLHVSGGQHGEPVVRSPKLILRRVNDVPGSSEAQRRWHIERVDWSAD